MTSNQTPKEHIENGKTYDHPVVYPREEPVPTRRRKRTAFPLFLLDGLLVTAGLLLAYWLRFRTGIWTYDLYFPPDKYYKAIPFVLASFWGTFIFLGLYETRRTFTYPLLFANTLKGVLAAVLAAIAISFWYREYLYSRWVTLIHGVTMTFGLSSLRYVYLSFLGRRRKKGLDQLNLLVVGTGPAADRLVETLGNHPELGYRVTGYLTPDESDETKEHRGRPILGSIRTVLPAVRSNVVHETAIALEEADRRDASRIVHRCRAEGLGVKIVPSLTDLMIGEPGIALADDLFWMDVERTTERKWQAVVKRTIDILASAVVLVPSLPLFGLVAAAIRWDSEGHIIFRQIRAGENGKPFTMYKFRSMVQDAEKRLSQVRDQYTTDDLAFKPENDPRVTSVGRLLRRWSLDELPQLWNVLKGDMSLVGPRPELLETARKYDERASERLRLRPGLTGYQQVQCRGIEDFEARLRYDLYYINNQTVFLDLAIVLQTLWVVLMGSGRH